MAREFPSIVDFASAFGFAVEAERAGAGTAAAAEVIAPDAVWRATLEQLVCAHDDRVEKLTRVRPRGDGMTIEALHGLAGTGFAAVLGGEPATTWPAAAEQVAAVEDTIAAYHETFVASAADALGAQARSFEQSAQQARNAAAQVRALLG